MTENRDDSFTRKAAASLEIVISQCRDLAPVKVSVTRTERNATSRLRGKTVPAIYIVSLAYAISSDEIENDVNHNEDLLVLPHEMSLTQAAESSGGIILKGDASSALRESRFQIAKRLYEISALAGIVKEVRYTGHMYHDAIVTPELIFDITGGLSVPADAYVIRRKRAPVAGI